MAINGTGGVPPGATEPARTRPGPKRQVVLGVCGGIAAYKVVMVCRQLVDAGVHVVPVLTEEATRFVGEVTFSALASEPVQKSLWDEASPIPHTTLGQRADLVVVAPATAHLIGRYAAGLADDLLTATLLATRAPVLVCPAMHTEMWEHPAVQANLAILSERGVHVMAPEEGHLAGGDEGAGRLPAPSAIVALALSILAGQVAVPEGDLAGRRVLVSAGGTREPLDPVRVITNRSSGKQGHALAEQAARRGAAVTLVTASSLPLSADLAGRVRRVPVETAGDMEAAMNERSGDADVIVMAAAVSDFRPKVVAAWKLTKDEGVPEVVLEPTPDILAALGRARRPGQVLVGFAAETGNGVERARAKLVRKQVDLMVVNDVSAPGVGFDHDTNAVTILDADGGTTEVPLRSKAAVADAVLDAVVARLGCPAPRSAK